MNRDAMMRRALGRAQDCDFLVIGGGATGVGVAVDAASRGYSVVLLEQSDFGKGTSSRSTKLIHGGVRYLQQGNIPLVMEALKERGILRTNAPHLVHDLPFVVPNYQWWEAPFYGIGMRVYDALAGKYGFGPSRNLTREETIARIPTIETEGLRGGVVYHDGQFDDARLLINMAETAAEQGAALLNYIRVDRLIRNGDGFIAGVLAQDVESGASHTFNARAVLNCTGVFSDAVRQLDEPEARPIIRPSQGVHIVLDRSFLPGDSAIMVPHTDDGRVLFAIPWHERVIIGTTDTPIDHVDLEPVPLAEEVEFILHHAVRYLTKDPSRSDVLSVFAGLRPLVDHGEDNTAAVSREHSVLVSSRGLITIAGGKWTTYRRMAEDAVDHAATLAGLEPRECITRELDIHGIHRHTAQFGQLAHYGSDALAIREIIADDPALGEPLHPRLPALAAEVVWAVQHEMARTVDDFLARRTRSLLLDARAAAESAERVASIMAGQLGMNDEWRNTQTTAFRHLARNYILDS